MVGLDLHQRVLAYQASAWTPRRRAVIACGSRGRIRTCTEPGLSRLPLPVGPRGRLVPRVGIAPTSPGLQSGAWAASATEETGGKHALPSKGAGAVVAAQAKQLMWAQATAPARLMVDAVGFEPTLSCLQGRRLPKFGHTPVWITRQESNLHPRGQSPVRSRLHHS